MWKQRDSLEKKIPKKKSLKFTNNFWIIPTFHGYFPKINCPKISILHAINILPNPLATWLTQFCINTRPTIFISDLAYTACTNPLSQSNLSYKKLIKCSDTTNFICMSLNYRKAKNIVTLESYIFWLKVQKLLRH